MADQSQLVNIITWPKEGSIWMDHRFNMEKPCPVSISIENQPVKLEVHSSPERPFNMNMAMNVRANEPIPVCISLCQPICAQSEYKISIDIFNNPFATISLIGKTILFACRDESVERKI